jgi:hypothetical protein
MRLRPRRVEEVRNRNPSDDVSLIVVKALARP